jgi:hypothetical protein
MFWWSYNIRLTNKISSPGQCFILVRQFCIEIKTLIWPFFPWTECWVQSYWSNCNSSFTASCGRQNMERCWLYSLGCFWFFFWHIIYYTRGNQLWFFISLPGRRRIICLLVGRHGCKNNRIYRFFVISVMNSFSCWGNIVCMMWCYDMLFIHWRWSMTMFRLTNSWAYITAYTGSNFVMSGSFCLLW